MKILNVIQDIEMYDITQLKDTVKQYIPGLKSYTKVLILTSENIKGNSEYKLLYDFEKDLYIFGKCYIIYRVGQSEYYLRVYNPTVIYKGENISANFRHNK